MLHLSNSGLITISKNGLPPSILMKSTPDLDNPSANVFQPMFLKIQAKKSNKNKFLFLANFKCNFDFINE